MNKSRKTVAQRREVPGRVSTARQSNGHSGVHREQPLNGGAPVTPGASQPHTIYIELPPGLFVDDIDDVVLLETSAHLDD